jgi:hypothetical protein
MAIKYINIFQSKALQNLPKVGIFGFKINHLATQCVCTTTLQEKSRLLQSFFISSQNYFSRSVFFAKV